VTTTALGSAQDGPGSGSGEIRELDPEPRPVRPPVDVGVDPALADRDRVTCAFRLVLAIPHLLLVGGPIALAVMWAGRPEGQDLGWQGSGGVLGAVALVAALLSWFAIVFTGRQPAGLWNLGALYLRWRVRAVAYTALLRDEYPPFGDGPYPAYVELAPPVGPRNRVTTAFRLVLAVPHVVAVWLLGIAWAFTTIAAWFTILFTGRYPPGLYRFGVGVLRWNTRVEAYVLLLDDAYPPFSLD
jgi:hypothetical protein